MAEEDPFGQISVELYQDAHDDQEVLNLQRLERLRQTRLRSKVEYKPKVAEPGVGNFRFDKLLFIGFMLSFAVVSSRCPH